MMLVAIPSAPPLVITSIANGLPVAEYLMKTNCDALIHSEVTTAAKMRELCTFLLCSPSRQTDENEATNIAK